MLVQHTVRGDHAKEKVNTLHVHRDMHLTFMCQATHVMCVPFAY